MGIRSFKSNHPILKRLGNHISYPSTRGIETTDSASEASDERTTKTSAETVLVETNSVYGMIWFGVDYGLRPCIMHSFWF